jgi:uridine phosphorylase
VTERKYHVGLAQGDVGEYVLTPGDPFRTAIIAKFLDGAREMVWSREYRTFTGSVNGTRVSTTSSGIGGPSAAIMVEELKDLGVHTFLRVGTCGAAQPGIRIGDLIIATGSVRSEGTPDGYVPREFPAISDHDLVSACVESATRAGVAHHKGIIRSVDALYSDLLPETMPRGARERSDLEMWSRAGVIANDMESSTIMVVASIRKLRACSILLVTDELGAGEIQHHDPSYMERMLKVAIGAIAIQIERDHAAPR